MWNEANKGECFFIAYNGELKRIISVAAITVRYQNKVLCESKQVFVTGETNVRPKDAAITEKMLCSENSNTAFRRALLEEMQELSQEFGPEWVNEKKENPVVILVL